MPSPNYRWLHYLKWSEAQQYDEACKMERWLLGRLAEVRDKKRSWRQLAKEREQEMEEAKARRAA